MEDIKLSSTIWKVIIFVEKGDMKSATKLCGDALKECDQLYSTVNLADKKAIDRFKDFIIKVKNKPNDIGKQLQKTKTDFEKVILPFLKENIRSKQMASNQVTPRKRSDATKKEYLTGHVKHFRDIFDGLWPEAHDALTSHGLSDEKIIAGILLEVVERAFTMNRDDAEKELKEAQRCAELIVTHGNVEDKDKDIKEGKIAEETKAYRNLQADRAIPRARKVEDLNINEGKIAEEIRAYRNLQADRAIPRARKNFLESILGFLLKKKGIVEKTSNKHLEEYAMKCVEVTWYLCAEDPPVCMVLVLDEGTQLFDETLYEPSTKRGAMIDYVLWPALKHSENGSVLVKGKAECKN